MHSGTEHQVLWGVKVPHTAAKCVTIASNSILLLINGTLSFDNQTLSEIYNVVLNKSAGFNEVFVDGLNSTATWVLEWMSNFDDIFEPLGTPQVEVISSNLIACLVVSFVLLALGLFFIFERITSEVSKPLPVVVEDYNEELLEELQDRVTDPDLAHLYNITSDDVKNMSVLNRKHFGVYTDSVDKLIEDYGELDKNRMVEGVTMNYKYVVCREWYFTKKFIMLLHLVAVVALLGLYFVQYNSDKPDVVSAWIFGVEGAVKYRAFKTLKFTKETSSSWLGGWSPFNDDVSEYDDYIRAYEVLVWLEEFTSILRRMSLQQIYLLITSSLFELVVVMWLLGDHSIDIEVKLNNTPLEIDLRPDDMRKLSIRHRDAKLSEVYERPNFRYRMFRLFLCDSFNKYVVSFELVSQLASPSHFNYGATEEDVLHKMSHSASVTCQINIDRHDYTRTNCFENSVRLAKYIYLSRHLASMSDF